MVTIRDVARRAGLSIAAVSYALNDKEGVREETKKKVRRIAEEMGYIPNSLAKGLLLKRTHIIGLVIPDISNLYIGSFIKYLDRYARRKGFFLLLGSMSNAGESEAVIFDELIARNVDSFIISPGSCDEGLYRAITGKLDRRNIPFLFSPQHFPGIDSSYVVPDLEEGEYQVTRHLLEQGYRDLAFVGGNREAYTSGIRYKGFGRALAEAGIEPGTSRYINIGTLEYESGYRAIKDSSYGQTLPDAFVALNDSIAYGIIKALGEKGLRVPDDVGVVGFDDLDLPCFDSERLTTIRIPLEDMARMCIDILMDPDRGKARRQCTVPVEMIVRNSSGRRKGQD